MANAGEAPRARTPRPLTGIGAALSVLAINGGNIGDPLLAGLLGLAGAICLGIGISRGR